MRQFSTGINSVAKSERVQKPVRIPPQTPPAGGKRAEAGQIHSPRQIVSPCQVHFNHLDFARNSFELCPINSVKIRNSNFRQKYGRREAPTIFLLLNPISFSGGERGIRTLYVQYRLSLLFCKVTSNLFKSRDVLYSQSYGLLHLIHFVHCGVF